MDLALIILILVLFISLITPVLYIKFGYFKKFYHDVMGWHRPVDYVTFNGQFNSTCKYCNKNIIQDSQGNWS